MGTLSSSMTCVSSWTFVGSNGAATILTRFVRDTVTVRFAAKYLMKRLHGVRQSQRREGRHTPVLEDTTNTPTVRRRRRSRVRNVGGRPKKAKRGGGRRPCETPDLSLVCDT